MSSNIPRTDRGLEQSLRSTSDLADQQPMQAYGQDATSKVDPQDLSAATRHGTSNPRGASGIASRADEFHGISGPHSGASRADLLETSSNTGVQGLSSGSTGLAGQDHFSTGGQGYSSNAPRAGDNLSADTVRYGLSDPSSETGVGSTMGGGEYGSSPTIGSQGLSSGADSRGLGSSGNQGLSSGMDSRDLSSTGNQGLSSGSDSRGLGSKAQSTAQQTEDKYGRGASHATGKSKVPEAIQKMVPKALEEKLPESLHPTK